MKYLLLSLLAVATLSGCKKDDDEIPTQQVSKSSPVTSEMYQFLRGQWKFKDASSSDTKMINFINDSTVDYRISIPTGVYMYKLEQQSAVNVIHMWSTDSANPYESKQFFLIENGIFKLVPDGEMAKKQ